MHRIYRHRPGACLGELDSDSYRNSDRHSNCKPESHAANPDGYNELYTHHHSLTNQYTNGNDHVYAVPARNLYTVVDLDAVINSIDHPHADSQHNVDPIVHCCSFVSYAYEHIHPNSDTLPLI